MIAGESARIKHLLRRTAFGYRTSEIKHWESLGEHGVLKALVDYDDIPDPIPTLAMDKMGSLVAPADTDSLKRYWLFRFVESPRPLEETMTLFWHGHFATSDYKVQSPSAEWRQHLLLRKHAMGSFRDMIGAMATDSAMLVWLDGNNSTKKAPNENFSRELLELFTMGVNGGYTEHDVKEGAKSFTGWSYNEDQCKVDFHSDRYNPQNKSYLGMSGDFDLDQTLNIVARHPSTAKFISTKLFTFFVHDNPPPEEIDRLCKVYFKTNYSIRELVRAVLTSPHFNSNEALYAQVKSPVQYAVMATKALDVPYRWIGDMQSYSDKMGQELFNPPNVKGWKTGRNWINTNTMTVRLNFGTNIVNQLRYRGLVNGRVADAFALKGLDPDQVFTNPQRSVDELWDWLMPSAIMPDEMRKSLVAYMKADEPKKPDRNFYMNRAHGVIELIITSPEYQMA